MASPVIAAPKSKIAVAIPLVLKMACLNGTTVYKIIMAISCNQTCTEAGIFFFAERLKCLGSNVVVASGQTFLHNPVATTNNAGATGIKIFQNTNSPIEGKKIRLKKIAIPAIQTSV
jgi:hypothetical protein